MDSTLVVAKF